MGSYWHSFTGSAQRSDFELLWRSSSDGHPKGWSFHLIDLVSQCAAVSACSRACPSLERLIGYHRVAALSLSPCIMVRRSLSLHRRSAEKHASSFATGFLYSWETTRLFAHTRRVPQEIGTGRDGAADTLHPDRTPSPLAKPSSIVEASEMAHSRKLAGAPGRVRTWGLTGRDVAVSTGLFSVLL
jgi:hypothetical protein